MILRVTAVSVSGPSHLTVSFNNGVTKRVNVAPLLTGPVFEPLRNPQAFGRATLDDLLGVVTWSDEADFAPEALLALPDEGAAFGGGGENFPARRVALG
jgi:hypothetical protein